MSKGYSIVAISYSQALYTLCAGVMLPESMPSSAPSAWFDLYLFVLCVVVTGTVFYGLYVMRDKVIIEAL